MKFLDREKEKRELKAILSGEPDVVYFVYGPINSGKTALLMQIFEELPEDYRIFYINFRRVETRKYEDFVRAMFQPRDESFWEKFAKRVDLIKAALEYAEKLLEKVNFRFELPSRVIREFFKPGEKERDVFRYLEILMGELVKKEKKPVLVLDELQMLRDVKKNGYLLSDLFNFLIGMTKETHLCHCLCATSDCLFIEKIYSNARLEGRARYVLVDDLDRERAYKVYEELGIEDKELVWNYVGGKFGDILGVLSYKRRGYSEREAVEEMVRIEAGRLKHLKLFRLADTEMREEIWEVLKIFCEKEVCRGKEAEKVLKKGTFWIRENVLFYDPVRGEVRPQGRIIWKAIKREIREEEGNVASCA